MLKTSSLTPAILHIVKEKGTEQAFSSAYDDDFKTPGTYLCRQCGLALFRSEAKFPSGCGWPSFDKEIEGTVRRHIEINCSRCDAHLGYMFEGEKYTLANVRHCVNALALDFVNNTEVIDTEEAILAGGCFWGVEYYLQKLPGVVKTEVGFIGGDKQNPSSTEVANGNTGHVEAVRVIYDPTKINYETLAIHFFEIHNPNRLENNMMRPSQYKSAIFYYDETQKQIAEKLVNELQQMGHNVETVIQSVSTFWPADAFNQNYYNKQGKAAECHVYEKKFNR